MLPIQLDFQHLSPDVERDDVLAWQGLIDQADKLVTKGKGTPDFLDGSIPAMVITMSILTIKRLVKRHSRQKGDVSLCRNRS